MNVPEYIKRRNTFFWALLLAGTSATLTLLFIDVFLLTLGAGPLTVSPLSGYLSVVGATCISLIAGLIYLRNEQNQTIGWKWFGTFGISYSILLVSMFVILVVVFGSISEFGGNEFVLVMLSATVFSIPVFIGILGSRQNNTTIRIALLLVFLLCIVLMFALVTNSQQNYRQSIAPDSNISITQVSCGNISINHQGGEEIDMYLLKAQSRVNGNSSSVPMRLNRATPTPDANGYIRAKFKKGDSISLNGVSEGEIALKWTHPSGGASFVLASSEIRGCQ